MPAEFGFSLQALPRIVGLFQCWPHPEGCRLAEAVAIEPAQFNSALQQALELLPSGQTCLRTEAVMALLDAQGAGVEIDHP